jgi:CheY-like chemotaxis protein
MKCPRCQHVFSATPDAGGIVTCPSCASRLRARPAAGPSAPSPAPAGPRPAPVAVPSPASKASPVPAAVAAADETLPEREPARERSREAAPAASPAGLDAVLAELRAIRDGQREILQLLRNAPPAPSAMGAVEPFGSFGDEVPAAAPPPPAVRTRRRKTVLLIDDDRESLQASVEALERAEVPVRAVSDGAAGLAAIAEEKPDVIVMELDIHGSMGGKDVINMIKATMEWVDVPIVLYTRMPIENQREARQIHGADEYVLKGPQSAEALVARVIAVFRRG